jgi:hypothetical protein
MGLRLKPDGTTPHVPPLSRQLRIHLWEIVMRIIASAVVLSCALIATPSIAATTYTSSFEGQATESQFKGPYSRVRGPDRGGRFIVSGPNRQDRPLWRYRWNPVLVR